jgi:uncharacterized membrane protein (UPF0127 family)
MIKHGVLIVFLTLGAGFVQASETCSSGSVDIRGDWGQAHFNVEVADDAEEQQKGLMFREKMSASAGMLFVYERPHTARFWMKNTLIPLDMIFLDKNGRVTRIAENAKPLDETPIDGGDNVLMILEINGGMARGLGITVGSELRHPAFDSAIAAWPCPAE